MLHAAACPSSAILCRQMDGVISQHHEPKAGAAPPLFSELHASGFGEQFLVNLRRNFTIYNRSPGIIRFLCVCVCVFSSVPAWLVCMCLCGDGGVRV